jgi:hypothetical protein
VDCARRASTHGARRPALVRTRPLRRMPLRLRAATAAGAALPASAPPQHGRRAWEARSTQRTPRRAMPLRGSYSHNGRPLTAVGDVEVIQRGVLEVGVVREAPEAEEGPPGDRGLLALHQPGQQLEGLATHSG